MPKGNSQGSFGGSTSDDANISTATRAPSLPTSPKDGMEYLFKVLIVGDSGAGKTSLIRRYTQNTFTSLYKATIGVDFFLKTLEWEDGTIIRLQFWDIAGQDRFSSMTRVFFREAVACMVVYDVENPTSFESSDRWKEDVDKKVTLPNGERIPCLLLGNKKDQDSECQPFIRNAAEFCKSRGYLGWFETSAKDNINIDESTKCLVCHILAKHAELGLGLGNLRDPVVQLKRAEEVERRSFCCN